LQGKSLSWQGKTLKVRQGKERQDICKARKGTLRRNASAFESKVKAGHVLLQG
jgi:hypothetical protein